MIPLYKMSRIGKSIEIKDIRGCQGVEGERGLTANGYRFLLGAMKIF